MMPRFQFAFRRTLFYLLLILAYLVIGSLIFFFLWKRGSGLKAIGSSSERLDFERAELLNVLYAEAIGRQEHDWSLLANQKLDSYEKSLSQRIESGQIAPRNRLKPSFGLAFRHCFSLITTIGPVDIDDLNIESKIFSMFYAAFGIPFVLLYLGQCARAITSVISGVKQLLLLLLSVLFLVSIAYDVVEQGADDTPFIDAILSVFLQMSTIGCEDDKDELPSILLYISAAFGISAFSVTFTAIQEEIERLIGPYELKFTHQYAKMERAISGSRLEVLQEDDTEDYSEHTS
ncbi:unnamed protein product [Bursaphelenchus xylophilus]|uniref:(pine wood nematode) hypothetical protein n=1 Tax=Bursaphelenchus xylophilus TaxID=6326 RepID=A0A1I7SQQ4_BURXY|nr:unnamed protein product [Bursaphelenchus xylophilus]CAG9110233.1 unnamed protein product [Bursaphelenchus xylophilus]